MITAMILAASAAATLPPVYYDAAYLTGRCRVWMLPDVQTAAEQTINADPGLRLMYDAGVADSRREPLRGDVCAKAMRSVRTDIVNQDRQANRSFAARGTDTR